VSARHFEIIKRPELIVPEAALRRRSICYSGEPATCTFEAASSIADVANTHTHSGLKFGPESSDRILIVTLSNEDNSDGHLTNVTIGGVPATRLVRRFFNQNFPTTATPSSEIWAAQVPTGTSGSVVLNFNTGGNAWDSAVAVYAATGLRSMTPTATAGGDDVSHFGTLNLSATVQGGGFVIATAYFEGTGAATSATWTGITQTFFKQIDTGSGAQSDGLAFASSTQSISTTTKFNGGSLLQIVGCIAAFR